MAIYDVIVVALDELIDIHITFSEQPYPQLPPHRLLRVSPVAGDLGEDGAYLHLESLKGRSKRQWE